jgi:hypothetical protein
MPNMERVSMCSWLWLYTKGFHPSRGSQWLEPRPSRSSSSGRCSSRAGARTPGRAHPSVNYKSTYWSINLLYWPLSAKTLHLHHCLQYKDARRGIYSLSSSFPCRQAPSYTSRFDTYEIKWFWKGCEDRSTAALLTTS